MSSKVKYTPAQEAAINTRNSDILISASAGSGKTSVLVERVIKEVIADQMPVDQLLVITFTNAAAEEMKKRIKQRLEEESRKPGLSKEERNFLTRQLTSLETANISTIDSFCLDVVRRFYYTIDLDPDFSILTDETQQSLLKERALREVEHDYLESPDPVQKQKFATFYDAFLGDRNADASRDLLNALYNYAMAKPDYEDWLSDLCRPYQVPTSDLVDSPLWQKQIKPYLLAAFGDLREKVAEVLALADMEQAAMDKIRKLYELEAAHLEQYLESLDTDDPYDVQLAKARDCIFEGTLRKVKACPEASLEAAEVRNEVKDRVSSLFLAFYAVDNQQQKELMDKGYEVSQIIAEVELAFIERFAKIKRGERVLDFSDMEQFAYKILTKQDEGGDLARSFYQNKFKEIMVDEYQDTNALQDGLIQSLKQEGKNNVFMVGDVKQSIYGFRQAEPSLFIAKYDDFGQAGPESGKKRIIFPENFRSSQPVVDNVNMIFDPVLTKDFGGIDYKSEGQLKYAAGYKKDLNLSAATEVLFHENLSVKAAENDADDDGEAMDPTDVQMIISRIQQMVKSQMQIYDPKTKTKRAIKYGDIAILTRAKSNNLAIKQTFDRYQIPLFVMDVENYFQTFELTVVMSFLKVIDNPDQDIPLVAVLRSPIFNFTSSDFANIRLAQRSVSFFTAMESYARRHDDELAGRIQGFFDLLDDLRDFANSHRISELLWTIYQKTGFLEMVTAMANGEQRRLNLTALYERATAYESSGFRDLYQFINFIARMRKNQKDLSQPISSESAEDAVKLMTIHASKGLEYPVVFLVGLQKRYLISSDLSGSWVLDAEGLGMAFPSPVKAPEVMADTLFKSWLKIIKKQKLLEEEARLLYVALTRAKQKLVLVADIPVSAKTPLASKEAAWSRQIKGGQVSLIDKMNVNKPLDFLAPALAKYKEQEHASDLHVKDLVDGDDGQLRFVHYTDGQDEPILPEESEKPAADAALSKIELEAVNWTKKFFDYEYPNQAATTTTAYQTVSEIKKAVGDPDDKELENSHTPELAATNRYLQPIDTEPDFLFKKGASAAEIGTATHLVLQYYDYSQEPSRQNLDEQINQLVKSGKLTQALAEQINRDHLQWFISSTFASRFREHPERLYREQNFSIILNPGRLFASLRDFPGKILVHGTIDGYYAGENGIILFDYKTDHVDRANLEASIAELKEKYRGQLELYEKALNEISEPGQSERKVAHKYLILLDCQQVVEVTG